jgi:DNA repair protein RadC
MTDVIRDLPWDDRPRERMLRHGASTLSNAELIALLLGSGVPGKNAVQLARELLVGGMDGLNRLGTKDLAGTHGVGPAKATRIVAAFEIARRVINRDPEYPEEPPPYDQTALGRVLIGKYAHYVQEHVGAVFLDTREHIIAQREIFVGTVDHALVSPRDVIRLAVADHTAGVVLFHNHPSGNPAPSPFDIEFTKKMQDSLKLVDLKFVDHLIVGKHGFTSMRNRGLLG